MSATQRSRFLGILKYSPLAFEFLPLIIFVVATVVTLIVTGQT
jgi:hypothetical protein